jgi:hypothetical protein
MPEKWRTWSARKQLSRRTSARLARCYFGYKASLDYLAVRFPEGREGFVEMMRWAREVEPKLGPIVRAWDDLSLAKRRSTSLDQLAQASPELTISRIAGAVAEAAMQHGMNMSNMIAGMAHPKIVQTSIERALRPDGIQDRKLQFMHSGFLPHEGGSVFNVSASAAAESLTSTVVQTGPALPSFEAETIERTKLIREGEEENE